eukprot:CAMPEP_0175156692 /NCGR_PEP_ID=MMETSP0087-20121206/21758_1 /TAXON_ID=136419 /ORGANISM="Unknown Unknown, Strain D1" /LENGTH=213 /DNA_ID=CAMNT_0016444159 /DNA_START=21 /DNA_END=662 /DNA_ORIENTATION=+
MDMKILVAALASAVTTAWLLRNAKPRRESESEPAGKAKAATKTASAESQTNEKTWIRLAMVGKYNGTVSWNGSATNQPAIYLKTTIEESNGVSVMVINRRLTHADATTYTNEFRLQPSADGSWVGTCASFPGCFARLQEVVSQQVLLLTVTKLDSNSNLEKVVHLTSIKFDTAHATQYHTLQHWNEAGEMTAHAVSNKLLPTDRVNDANKMLK